MRHSKHSLWTVKIGQTVLVMVILGAIVLGQSAKVQSPAADQGMPDLVPLLNHPMNGQIMVKNIGTGSAGPSKLTLDCQKMEAVPQMHSCPDLPLSAFPIYFDSAFLNHATVNVPALPPGATFTHTLSFWDVSKWPAGKYRFTVVADAAHTVLESNTKNNVAMSTLIVR